MLLGLLVFGFIMAVCSMSAVAGTATLHWQQPATNADGTPLTDLAGYKVYYGTSSGTYANSIDVGNTTTYQVQGLTVGATYFFAVTSYNTAQVESVPSQEVSTVITAPTYTLSVTKSGTGGGSVSSSPSGISCGTTCSSSFASGTAVTLTASPDAASMFTGWSGACSGTGACSVAMTAARSVTASFAANTFTVTPTAGANGTINPSSPQTVNQNSTASFTVTPNNGYSIASVTGCSGTLSGNIYTTGPVTANCTVTASFAALSANTLTVTRIGSGTVVSSPSGINCGQVCSAGYTAGTSLTLAATPAAGWSFTGWSGACSGTGSCGITMNSSQAVTAAFSDVQPPSLTVSTLPDGSLTRNQDLNVSGTVTDNGQLQGLVINGTTVPVQSNGAFSYLVTLAAGKNTITTVATDQAGNTTSDVRTITLDQTAPALVITDPADNSATADSVMTVSGTLSEPGTVSVALNGGAPQLASMNGQSFTATVILRPGLNTISVAAADVAGNASGTDKRSVTYDNGKPGVAITSPPTDETTAQGSVPVQGQVTDSLTPSTATISVDGVTAPLPLDGSGAFSTTAVLSAEGQHAITVTATNQAGVSTSVQRNVQYTMFGDLNASGSVDLADAVLAFRDITGEQPITDPLELKRCDVAPLGADGKPSPDGTIGLGDVVIILRKVVGLVNW